MQQAYINARLNFRPTCYGRKLLPLSLGNTFLLEMINSPFVLGLTPTFSDVVTATLFCSKTFAENCAMLEDKENMVKEITAWGKHFAKLNLQGENEKEQLEILNKYFEFYQIFPRRWDDRGKRVATKTPWQMAIAWQLMEKFSESEVWEMPLTRAMAWLAVKQDNAESNLMSDDEIEQIEKLELEEKVNV